MATQTQRRAAALAFLASCIFSVEATHRPPPRAGSISVVRQHKDIINLRGGAIDDGRRPPPSSRYSSSYDDVGRYNGREGRDNNSRRFDDYDDRPSRDGRSYPNYDNERNLDNTDDKKSRGWFGRSKEEANPSDNEQQFDQGNNMWNNNNGITGLPPPPPPPPPPSSDATGTSLNIDINPAETERTPIHYNFPSAEVAADERRTKDTSMEASAMDETRSDDSRRDVPDIPFIEEDELSDRDRLSSRRRRRRSDDDDDVYSSARRDAVTTFMSTKRGAFKVRLGSVIVGAALGGFMGKVSSDNLVFDLRFVYKITISTFIPIKTVTIE